MLTLKKLESVLKDKYNIAVGENSLEAIRDRIITASKNAITVFGRSYTTGRKKIIRLAIKDLR